MRLESKSVLKTLPILFLHCVIDATLVTDDDVVGLGYKIHRNLTLSTGDLRTHIMAMRLCPGAIVISNLAAPELDHADCIVDVVRFLQLGVVLQGTGRPAGLWHRIVEIPERQVYIVDSLEHRAYQS